MVALFGGSFDPFHNGHFEVLKALKKTKVRYTILQPTYLSPFKNSWHLSPQKRLATLQPLRTSKVRISDFEIRQNKTTTTYTSLLYWRKTTKQKLALVIGEDGFYSLHKWHNFKRFKAWVEIWVAPRNNHNRYTYNRSQTHINLKKQARQMGIRRYVILNAFRPCSSTLMRYNERFDDIPPKIKIALHKRITHQDNTNTQPKITNHSRST